MEFCEKRKFCFSTLGTLNLLKYKLFKFLFPRTLFPQMNQIVISAVTMLKRLIRRSFGDDSALFLSHNLIFQHQQLCVSHSISKNKENWEVTEEILTLSPPLTWGTLPPSGSHLSVVLWRRLFRLYCRTNTASNRLLTAGRQQQLPRGSQGDEKKHSNSAKPSRAKTVPSLGEKSRAVWWVLVMQSGT